MTTFTFDWLQSAVRTMNLWNGTFNDLPPSGWSDTGYDDSGWSLSAVPGTGAGSIKHLDTIGGGSGYGNTIPSGGPEAVWPDGSARDASQHAIFRWHFTAPSGITDVDMIGWTAPGSQFDWIGFNTHSAIFFNGFETDDGSTSMRTHTNAGADNVVAIYLGDQHLPPPFSTEVWTTGDAWLAIRVQIEAAGGGGLRYGRVIG